MSCLTWAQIEESTDSIGVQLDRLKAGLGTEGAAGTVCKAAEVNLERVQTIAAPTGMGGGDNAEAGADLLPGYNSHKAKVTAGSQQGNVLLQDALSALNTHIQNRGGAYNSFDSQADHAGAEERYSPSFAELARALGITLAPGNVFSPVIQFGTYSIAGAVGTFTDGLAIDIALYDEAPGEVEVTHAIGGANDLVLAFTLVDELGATTSGSATVPKGSAIGVKVDITVTTGKRIRDITNCTHSSGNDADAVKIQSKLDRTPAE